MSKTTRAEKRRKEREANRLYTPTYIHSSLNRAARRGQGQYAERRAHPGFSGSKVTMGITTRGVFEQEEARRIKELKDVLDSWQ